MSCSVSARAGVLLPIGVQVGDSVSVVTLETEAGAISGGSGSVLVEHKLMRRGKLPSLKAFAVGRLGTILSVQETQNPTS